jgi:acetyltransferase
MFLPPQWSRHNPIDILDDADAARYAKALETASRDDNSDGLLVVLTPQDMTDPLTTAESLANIGRIEGKPVLASWMGGPAVARAAQALSDASISNFAFPDAFFRITGRC